MRKPYGTLWILTLLSALFLSLPWLVGGFGPLMLFALTPLLAAERVASQNGVRRFWYWHYSCFVLWNAATTFWVCNATVGGGIFAVLANAFQMSLIFGLFRLSKKAFKGVLPYIFLALAWIAWERRYLVHAQISWPWLVLGNGFAGSLKLIQWYEFTGTLGGSLWVWACNLALFGLLVSILEGTWFRRKPAFRWACGAGTALLILLPIFTSLAIWNNYREVSEGKVNVLIVQPNFDPYQKFESLSQQEQNRIFIAQADAALPSGEARADWGGLILAPETFTSDIVLNDPCSSPTLRTFNAFLQGIPKANLLFGATTYDIYFQSAAPSPLARRYGDNGWTEDHNSAIITDSSRRFEIFHKSKLVVGTELTPYPKIFVPLDDLLGGVMGRSIGQKEISTLTYHAADSSTIPFGCAVCYESVYPEYCTGYVRKGARFMTIITNDAWWGDTPGYRQHASYASLRAIELRRDIARCGNTGISGVINQRGEYLSRSNWWKRESLSGEVNLSSELTFFAKHGDLAGKICTAAFLLMLLAGAPLLVFRKKKY